MTQGSEQSVESTPKPEEVDLVTAVHSQLLQLINNGTSEKVQLTAINLALQFIRDLDLTGQDSSDLDEDYEDEDEDGTF